MLTLLIESALRSLAVAAGAWLLLMVLRIRSPQIQHTSWLVVALASLSMPLLVQMRAIDIPAAAIRAVLDAPQLSAVSAATSFNLSPNLLQVSIGIYLLVSCALLARLVIGLARTWRLSRNAQRVREPSTQGYDVRTSAAIHSPVTFASIILLPHDRTTWSATTLQAVLAHESTHVQHFDFYVHISMQIHRAIFWFSPLAWWLPKKLGDLSEIISDDAAIEAIEDRSNYVNVLLEFAQRAQRTPTAIEMARRATVNVRIERILSETWRRSRISRRARFGIALCLAPVIAIAANVSASQQSRPSNETSITQSTRPLKPNSPNSNDVIVSPKVDPQHPLEWPTYPLEEKFSGHTGVCHVAVYVTLDGSVRDAKIRKSSGYTALDESALTTALAKWHLTPGTINGVPQPMWITVPVVFKLSESDSAADTGNNSVLSTAERT